MKLFSNEKVVVGLFSDQATLEDALKKLQAEGFGKDDDTLEIVDSSRITEEATDNPDLGQKQVESNAGYSTGGSIGVMSAVNERPDKGMVQENTQDMLTGLGVDDEEADFYARQVSRGNALIVFQGEEARVEQVAELMTPMAEKSNIVS